MRGEESHAKNSPMRALWNVHRRDISPADDGIAIQHYITWSILPDVVALERVVGIKGREGYSAKIDALRCNGLACGTPPQDQILTHLGYFDHPGCLAVPCASYNLPATKPAPVRLRVASDTGFCHGLDTALRSASMVAPAIALFFGLIVIVIAIRANVVLRQEDMVPMQWGLR